MKLRKYEVKIIKWMPVMHTAIIESENVNHARSEAVIKLFTEELMPDEEQPDRPFRTTVMHSKKIREDK